MKKRYSISFFVAAVVCVAALSFAYHSSYEHARKELQAERQKQEEPEEEDVSSVPAEGDATKADIYYLKNVNGFLAVYCSDKKTLYEHTSIRMDELPADLAAEIENWKAVETEERLYSFLESYSS